MVNIKFEDVISGSTRLKSTKDSLNKTKYCLPETTARCGALNYFAAGSLGISIRPQNVQRIHSRNTQTPPKRHFILCSGKKKLKASLSKRSVFLRCLKKQEKQTDDSQDICLCCIAYRVFSSNHDVKRKILRVFSLELLLLSKARVIYRRRENF